MLILVVGSEWQVVTGLAWPAPVWTDLISVVDLSVRVVYKFKLYITFAVLVSIVY